MSGYPENFDFGASIPDDTVPTSGGLRMFAEIFGTGEVSAPPPVPPAQGNAPNFPGIAQTTTAKSNGFTGGILANVVITVAMSFPKDAAASLDAPKIDIIKRAISSELALQGVVPMDIVFENSVLRLKVRLAPHISIDRLVRSIQGKVGYVWQIKTRELLIFDGPCLVDTRELSLMDIANLTL